MDVVVQVLTQAGPWGAIVVCLGLYAAKQQRLLMQVMEARVADAQKVVDTMLTLNQQWQETISELTHAIDALKGILEFYRPHD